MRVAYAYEWDAANPNVQSGRPRAILDQLTAQCGDVLRLFPLHTSARYLFGGKYVLNRMRRKTYRPDREPIYLRTLGRQIERRLRGLRMDCIFTPGSHLAAGLRCETPIVFCADATFQNVLETYDDFSDCEESFIRAGHEMDRDALANCSAAIYPTRWAAETAIRVYGTAAEKVHVVPFGANIDAPDEYVIRARLDERRGPVRVLFVGRDWDRKGADIVLAACEELHRSGIEVELHIVGITECPIPLPAFSKVHGLLDKRDPTGRRALRELFLTSDFLFVPSRAENYGMTFCEAAAFGLPVISTNVGGIPTIVQDSVTGVLIEPEAAPHRYAEAISDLLSDRAGYDEMALAAHRRFQQELNWDAFGERLTAILRELASK